MVTLEPVIRDGAITMISVAVLDSLARIIEQILPWIEAAVSLNEFEAPFKRADSAIGVPFGEFVLPRFEQLSQHPRPRFQKLQSYQTGTVLSQENTDVQLLGIVGKYLRLWIGAGS